MPATKQATKKHTSTFGPISQKAIPLRADPDALQAIENYQSYMLHNHNLMISTNKAINALLLNGWQYIKDAQEMNAQT